jgi:hypothetical protein
LSLSFGWTFPLTNETLHRRSLAGWQRELRPEHTIKQIADWAKDPVSVVDLMKVFHAAFNITCDESTTFRALVEMIAAQEVKGADPLSRT